MCDLQPARPCQSPLPPSLADSPLLPSCRLRQMKAKLQGSSTGGKTSKASPAGDRQPSGHPSSRQGAPSAAGGAQGAQSAANGPAAAAGGGSAAPADQRQSLPPLTPEEMRHQYAGAHWGLDHEKAQFLHDGP